MKKVLSAGQCGFDHSGISSLLSELGAEVVAVDSSFELLEELRRGKYALVLLNRVFDRTGEKGIALIPRILEAVPDVNCMLISNYEEAQAEATDAGAVPGFGKNQLRDERTRELLSGYLVDGEELET